MASYIARVELHSATYQDYEILHGAMGQRGFSRTILGSDGANYYLPTGTYDIASTSASLQQAFDAAVAATKETRMNYSIIVAERNAAKWVGLTKE